MKRLQTIIVATALLFATSAFATAGGPEKVAPLVKAAFEKNFNGAVNVNWEKTEGYYFAFFQLNEKQVTVAYNENGELLGTSQVITTSQLPLNVSLSLAGKYQDYNLAKTATELTYQGQTSYYIVAENSKQILKLKCTSGGDISVENKTKK
jgi:hypothetical protein